MMRILTPATSRRVAWKNGLGATLEIATDAAAVGGEWTWRLSIADVPARAQFSTFPGIDRFIACLAGPGLILERTGAHQLVPPEGGALMFPGEEIMTGEPLGPGVRDVNLMVRRDRWRGGLTLARGRPLTLDASLVMVHAPEDSTALRVSAADGACELAPGNTLIATGHVAISGGFGGVAVACSLCHV